jgi:hypothetical protein
MKLPSAVEMDRRLGLALPARVDIFGIETEVVVTFGEAYTPDVVTAIPTLTQLVLQMLTQPLAR